MDFAPSFFASIATAMPAVVYVLDVNTRGVVYVGGGGGEELAGYTPAELITLGPALFPTIVHPDDLPIMTSRLLSVMQPGGPSSITSEFRVRGKLSEWMWMANRSSVFARDETGVVTHMIGVMTNVTVRKTEEQNLAEERLRVIHASKLALLGEMAGGVAHEINNPLAIIKGRAAQLKAALESSTPPDVPTLLRSIDSIDRTCQRIATIVHGLKSFARDGGKDPMVPTNIKTVIEATLELCGENMRRQAIECTSGVNEDAHVMGRAVQLSQVLLNLLTNAQDALQNQVQPGKWVRIATALTSGTIEISVTDSGNGIAADVAAKMMEPFFTTKEVGKGPGLGLSIARGIMQMHGGDLTYDRQAGNTRFVMRLPLLTTAPK